MNYTETKAEDCINLIDKIWYKLKDIEFNLMEMEKKIKNGREN